MCIHPLFTFFSSQNYREVALEYLKSSTKMVRKLLEILFGNLGATLDDTKFESLTGLKMVNMNFYPTCPNPELTVGVGRHSDMGTLTVLLQDGIGGLYVKLEEAVEEGKDEWIEIPPIPGALVINVGDTMQVSTHHLYMLLELSENIVWCVLGPPKVMYLGRIRHEYGSILENRCNIAHNH